MGVVGTRDSFVPLHNGFESIGSNLELRVTLISPSFHQPLLPKLVLGPINDSVGYELVKIFVGIFFKLSFRTSSFGYNMPRCRF